MAKLGILLILIGLASLILPFMGFPLQFEKNILGDLRPWVALGTAVFGALLLFAGFFGAR